MPIATAASSNLILYKISDNTFLFRANFQSLFPFCSLLSNFRIHCIKHFNVANNTRKFTNDSQTT